MSTSLTPKNDQFAEKKFFGQPWGLANLFGIELWERFSYYGMQALLAFYLYHSVNEGGLGVSKESALSLVGAYGGFIYMCSLVASLVADRILGAERTLFYSSITVMCGHIALALIPGRVGLAIGLLAIGLGSGGVKTASSVVLGSLYDKHDTRRDAGFSIYYMAVNIGGLLGPLITGWLWGWKGFHWGFGAAAVGMALGLTQYVLMRKTTIGAAGSEIPNPLPRNQYLKWGVTFVVIAVLVTVGLITGLIPMGQLSNIVAVVAGIAVIGLLIQMTTSEYTTPDERSRMIGYIPLLICAIAFFAIFQSQFTVLALYSDERANRTIGGWTMSAAQVQSFNPLFILLLAPVFSALWTKLGERQPATPIKFGIANIVIGAALLVFLPFTNSGEHGTPLIVLVLILLLFTIGELMLSPVGNSLATKVAPEAFKSRTMAMWLMSVAVGNALSGTLGTMYKPEPAAEQTFFTTTGIGAIVLGIIVIALNRWITKKFIDVR